MKKRIIIYILSLLLLSIIMLLMKIDIKILIIGIVLILLFILILELFYFKKKKKIINIDDNLNKVDTLSKPKKEIKKSSIELPPDFDIDKYENIIKNLYIEIQNKFSNLKYDELKKLLMPELYEQFQKQMHHYEINDKCFIKENISFNDFNIIKYEDNKITFTLGVIEDKYTKVISTSEKGKVSTYESYYEMICINDDNWKLANLKLLYCHSKKKD